jgi:hypothetical protein
MKAVNLAEKLATFTEPWQPRTVGQFNGHDLMVVKAKGEFVWHKHDNTDDFFLVLSGSSKGHLRSGPDAVQPRYFRADGRKRTTGGFLVALLFGRWSRSVSRQSSTQRHLSGSCFS